MQPARYDLVIKENCDFSQDFLFTDPTTGAPIDITGYTGAAMARLNVGDLKPLVTFVVTVNGSAGVVNVSASKDVLSSLPVEFKKKCGVWDLLITDLVPRTEPLVEGEITFIPAVTR